MDAAQIKSLLAGRAEEVCQILLPSGKRVGNQWHAGDIRGGPGDSLKVHLSGQYLGFWKDFANDEDKGTILDLWMKTKNLSFKEALKEAAAFLKVDLTFEKKALQHKEERPAPTKGVKIDYTPVQEGSAIWAYLTDKRKLSPETLKAFGVCQTHDGKAIALPYRSDDGKRTEMVKYIALDRDADGGKKCWTSAGTQPALFGKETIRANHGQLVICEGEIDAMTVWQLGFSAVSVPYGAKSDNKDGKNPNDPWIAKDYEFLEQFQHIYLCFDSDDPGRKAAAGLVKRLGVERCLLVRLPDDAKDPNECLTTGRLGELGKALGDAKSLDPDHLKGAEEFRDAVLERFFPKDGKEPGFPLPWNMPFRIRPREVTIWTGFNGHGKSLLQSQVDAFLMSMGERVCIASMEIPADMTLQNLWIQCSAKKKPTDPKQFDQFYNWFTGKVWIYDRVGDVDHTEVLSVFRYAARRYGVTQFVIDSLDKLNVGRDDYDKQKSIMNDLCTLAKDMGAHIHFVAHARKPEHNDESRIPLKYDVSGSAAITNLTWNGITVWRNKKKEHALDEQHPDYEADPKERSIVAGQHDAFIVVWKQRLTGEEPVKKLWFDREAKQFHDSASYPGNTVYATAAVIN